MRPPVSRRWRLPCGSAVCLLCEGGHKAPPLHKSHTAAPSASLLACRREVGRDAPSREPPLAAALRVSRVSFVRGRAQGAAPTQKPHRSPECLKYHLYRHLRQALAG